MNYLEISNKLIESGYECFLVGGAVRDKLLSEQPTDYDLATNAKPKELINLFKYCKIKKVGKSFGVVIIDDVEVATFRKDRYYGSGNDNLEVDFADTIEEDLKRRDLTINAIAINLKTGRYVDPHNGISHLKNKIVCFVGSPEERISEDYCRILRAIRFCAKIQGCFTEDTEKALRDNIDFISFIKDERKRKEIIKTMQYKSASTFFYILHKLEGLRYLFPSLVDCFNHDHGKWHKEDVFVHNMIVGDSISTKFPIIKLAGYLHDVGKPYAYTVNGGENFGKHECFGKDIVEKELKKLTFSNDEINEICNLIRCHMYSLKDITPQAIRRLLKKFNDRSVDIDSFLRLKIADRMGNLASEPHKLSEIKNYIRLLKSEDNYEIPFSAHDLDLSGGEIKKIWSLEGKQIGIVQKYLLTKIISDGINNEKNLLIDIVNSAIERGEL